MTILKTVGNKTLLNISLNKKLACFQGESTHVFLALLTPIATRKSGEECQGLFPLSWKPRMHFSVASVRENNINKNIPAPHTDDNW